MNTSSLFAKSTNQDISQISCDKVNENYEELDDIILSLEFAINDINRDKNKFYIIEELENIITKLKNYSKNIKEKDTNIQNDFHIRTSKINLLKPPSSGITTIELTKNIKFKNNYSPLRPHRSNSKDFSTYNQSSNNISILSNTSTKSNIKIKDKMKNDINSSTKIPIRNGRSPSSTKYIGPKINGKKEGKGIYMYPNGCKYEGYFRNDKKEGKGIFYYSNGDRYEGNFEEGNYEGYGVFYFNNGDRYEGNFESNKYSGKGKYYYHNGDMFDGYWMNDQKYGEGTYYCKNGDKIVGKYYNGKPYGAHIKYFKNGKNIQVNY